MTDWAQTVGQIAASDDLHIAPFGADGATYGTPTWIWSVVVEGRLFVRAWNGPRSAWYRSAMTQRAGRVIAAGESGSDPEDGDPHLLHAVAEPWLLLQHLGNRSLRSDHPHRPLRRNSRETGPV